ncbi:hypothetical protein GRK68_001517 [Salmonella enterica]|nr:hypothetical protein [Salmonella enterica]
MIQHFTSVNYLIIRVFYAHETPNHDTVYIYSVRRETGRDQGVKVPDH